MKLTQDIKNCIANSVLCWLATSSEDNIPNVSPKEIFTLDKENNLLIANIASPKSAKNVRINEQVCISMVDILVQKGYKLIGRGELINRKEEAFEALSQPLLQLTGGNYPFSSLFKIKITQAKPILAPSYLLYPEKTTEENQIQAALKTYNVYDHLKRPQEEANTFQVKAIAHVKNSRKEVIDDNWGSIRSEIELVADIPPEAFEGIDDFSHLEIIFYMDRVKDEKAIVQYRHPRNNKNLPKLGTYAQRNKNRPNKIGLTTVELVKREGKKIVVKNLDAVDGTPILDIKPVMQEFLAKGLHKQPNWTKEILNKYW